MNRIAYLFADGNADSAQGPLWGSTDNKKMQGMDLAPCRGKPEVIGPGQEPLSFGKPVADANHFYLAAMETAKLLRPLARRRLITKRPFFVDIRTRKPCVLFLLVLLG
jgi:hypothetical protein